MKTFKRRFFVTIILFAIAILSNFTLAQNKPETSKPAAPKLEPQVQQIAGLNAKFIVALIQDGLGGAWIGTEDDGVFHYQVDGKISQFTTKNGLGDNNGYGLAIDKLGRLWVGHLNTGVSVFNGKDWKNYDVVDGPIGERIFDIKICPKDGDVWMATSAGISRYKIDSDDWEHLTREDGLLEDQASALAFKNDGTLIVGTQCHGLAIFNRTIKGEYRHSKNIVAPDRFGQGNISPVPLTPRGIGLPSNLINDIIVTKNIEAETIWIATNAGLVKSNDTFTKLEYWRGKDYVDKVKGLYGGSPKDWKPAPKEVMDQILPEDYLTCLAENEQGVIWIGTRQNGFYIADPKTGKKAYGNQKGIGLPDNFVTKILILDNGDYLIGSYGGGIVKPIKPYKLVDRQPAATKFNKDKIISVAQNNFPNLPSKIKPPTLEELKEMQMKLAGLNTPLPKIYAAYLGEDWKTRGDWMGRAFRDWAVMCAAVSPYDQHINFSDRYYSVHDFIGPNYKGNDVIRRWIHWMKSDDPRVLWNPYLGYRRQAEWDDHGEAYSWSMDGPDLWYMVEIKREGIFRIGMYFFNKDGHVGSNRMRDYTIEVYPASNAWTKNIEINQFPHEWKKFAQQAETQVRKMQPLAKGRVNVFWGGVHKYFVVSGAGNYFVKIDRNYGFNTILSSVMVDRLQGKPTWDEQNGVPILAPIRYDPPQLPESFDNRESRQIMLLWKTLDKNYNKKTNIEKQRKARIAAYVAATRNAELLSGGENEKQLAHSLKWRLNQWDDKQRKEWNETVKHA
ncbi:MAG: hypothetical protein LBP59_12345, partial [Planctomycetaceae bacterium]|nr:hypothetical protein [Planctomycetaceae bacterium]